MRVLIVSFYYEPEIGAAPSRITNLAKGLKSKGVEVDILTCLPNYPQGKIFEGYRGKFSLRENIDGINIRIPRNISGVSEDLFGSVFKTGLSNLLIVGPPSSGKTTILKDLIYNLSSGKNGYFYKVCVIDERKEISSSIYDFKLIGPNTDVLSGYPKSKGISIAVRTLSPDIIVCDEIGANEIDAIQSAVNCGVSFVFTIHAKNHNELINNTTYKKMIKSSCLDYVVFLKSSYEPGTIKNIMKVNEDKDENSINNNYRSNNFVSCNELYQAI